MAFQAPCAGVTATGQSTGTGDVRPNTKGHSVPYLEAAAMEDPEVTQSPQVQGRTNGANQGSSNLWESRALTGYFA